LPKAKDAREAVDAVKAHVPSIDPAAIAERLPKPAAGKRKILAVLGGLAAAAAVFGIVRKRRAPEPTPATLYTPPLPKP
jgi:hypothetical protein